MPTHGVAVQEVADVDEDIWLYEVYNAEEEAPSGGVVMRRMDVWHYQDSLELQADS